MSAVDATTSASGARAVTVSDSLDLPLAPCDGLYVGAAGDVKLTMANGDVITFSTLAAGIVHPLKARRVWSTGTTATGPIAIYTTTP